MVGFIIGYSCAKAVVAWDWINATNTITGGINVIS